MNGRSVIQVTTQSGARLVLRPAPSSDIQVAMEVFAVGSYTPPVSYAISPQSVRRVVDLGANAGFSVVFFATNYPHAQIEAYEPHPRQLDQLHAHIRMNGLEQRVTIRPVAVSNRMVDQLHLTDADAMASLGDAGGEGTIPVPVVDWFSEVGGNRIDILKIDIEGSEREILLDPRFCQLDIGTVMIEWHALPDWPHAEAAVKDVLSRMGYKLFDGPRGHYRGVDCGVLWAVR